MPDSFEMPHSVEAEQAALGSVLVDCNAIHSLAGVIEPADFYRPDHQLIFRAVRALAKGGRPTDVVTVADALERRHQLEDAGGLAYLGQLARETPTAANVVHYAEIVRERSAQRQLLSIAQTIERRVHERSEHTAQELIAQTQAGLADVQARSRVGKGLVSSAELVQELVDDLDRRADAPSGLSIGLSDFDEISGGLEPGDLVVIAARPGMGKTALLVSIADSVSQHSPVAVFSAEMPARQLMRRAVSKTANVSQDRLRRADRLTGEDWAALTPAISTLAERRLWIDDTSLPSLEYIRAEAVSLKARHGLALVMVDYVQLVKGRGNNRYEELREVAYGLKALAKDLAIPVIVLAQLNRGVESRDDKRPYLSDLRDSGAIEEAADLVGLLYSEGYYNPDFGMPSVLECAIEKNRHGQRDVCLWHFAGQHSRITVLEDGPRAQYRHHRATKQKRGSSDDL